MLKPRYWFTYLISYIMPSLEKVVPSASQENNSFNLSKTSMLDQLKKVGQMNYSYTISTAVEY